MGGGETWQAVQRRWPVLASIGINAGLIALLALIPPRHLPSDAASVIEVTLVELDEPETPEPDTEPGPVTQEPEPPEPAEEPAPPPPQTDSTVQAPAADTPPAPGPQSPILAQPDETADAAPRTGRRSDIPEIDLPIFDAPEARQQARTENALRGLACNRLGRERPDWCDEDETDILDAPQRPAFAEQPDMAPKEWADFELPERETWCGTSDGVIRDIFVADSNPYRQGAASAVGTLATDSLTAPCPD